MKLSTTYRFPGEQWRVGTNLRWQDRIHHSDDWMGYAYNTEQEAYTVVDAMVGYTPTRQLDLQLNVTNLFDKEYFSAINAQPVEWGGNSVYGEPRNVTLSARYKF
ncbi:FhuE receptor precursor [compost metagenome]